MGRQRQKWTIGDQVLQQSDRAQKVIITGWGKEGLPVLLGSMEWLCRVSCHGTVRRVKFHKVPGGTGDVHVNAGTGGHDCPCCTSTSGSPWRNYYWGQTRKWIMLHSLSLVLSHRHLLLETEDMLGGYFILCAALHLVSFLWHSSSLKLEKALWWWNNKALYDET